MNKLIYLFFPLLVLIFFAHYVIVGQATYGDGIYHYAFTRSLVKDHDLNFRNELGHHYSHKNNNAAIEEPLDAPSKLTKTGLTKNKYGIGAPLSWIPVFILADGIAHGSGYGDIYQINIGILNVFFVWLAIFVLYKFLRKSFSKRVAFFVCFTFLFGSQLFYYGAVDVINSHPYSFLISTIFFVLWAKTFSNRQLITYFVLGMLAGILMLIRTQEGAFVIFILLEQLLFIAVQRKNIIKELFQAGIRMCVFGIGALILFFPQMLTWKIVWGSYFQNPYFVEKGTFDFIHPHIIEVLVNTNNGLFLWTPVFLLALFGLITLAKKYRPAQHALLLFGIEFYVIASWSAWTQGESFGIRMLIPTIPFLCVGLAHVYTLLENKFSIKIVYLISIFLILLNFILVFYFLLIKQSPTYDRGIPTQKLFILPHN